MSSAVKFMEELAGPMTVGKLIRAFRTRNDLTLAELGEIVGQGVSYVSDLERDKKSISLAQVKDFAERMGESVEHYARVWIKQELSEANIDADVEIRLIDGQKSAFAKARKEIEKHKEKASVARHHGTAKKATRRKA
jgi:transcriptional regulator with XRE-family HTH domain